MGYVKTSVIKPGDNLGLGGDKSPNLIIFDMDDVSVFPSRDSKGIGITDNIVFKAGAYMIQMYATPESIKNTSKSDGGTDNKGVLQGVEFEHPGNRLEVREFRANWMNRNIGILVIKPKAGIKDLYGEPGAPLQMTFDATDDKSGNTTKFTFASAVKGSDVAIYGGTVTYDTVKGTAAAGAVTVDVANGEGQYQLTVGAAAAASITGLTNPVDGGVYTLLGSGGTYPSTVVKSTTVILKLGTTWTALAGATLTLRAIKSDAAAFTFIEVSRT